MDLMTAAVLTAFMLATALVFVKTVPHGFMKAVAASMIIADLFLAVFLVLGIDRPLFIINTRLGSVTVTALMMFMLIKIPLTLYILRSKKQALS